MTSSVTAAPLVVTPVVEGDHGFYARWHDGHPVGPFYEAHEVASYAERHNLGLPMDLVFPHSRRS